MNSNRKAILIATAAVAILLLIAFMPWPRQYDWDINHHNPAPGEPYGIEMFDELLTRSLDNGYEVRNIDYHKGEIPPTNVLNANNKIGDIVKASTDTALLVIDRYNWYFVDEFTNNNNNTIYPAINLLDFAKKGGTAMYVTRQDDQIYGRLPIYTFLDYLDLEEEIIDYNIHNLINDSPKYQKYSKKWFNEMPHTTQRVYTGHKFVDIDYRLVLNNFSYNRQALDRYNRANSGKMQIRPLLTDSTGENFYLLDIYFPKTGGHLYVCATNLLFTNMGITAPGAPEILNATLGHIDHKPVARLVYPYQTPYRSESKADYNTDDSHALSVLSKNKALSFAWLLTLAFVACLFITGLMRRHPVARGLAADDLDKTDVVAVREYKYRHSPLLHFLYQCSWLYKSGTDHRDLFDVNVRQVCRQVNRHLGIELLTCKMADLGDVAEYFSRLQGRPKSEVLAELEWLVLNATNGMAIDAKQFRRSQQIADRYNK